MFLKTEVDMEIEWKSKECLYGKLLSIILLQTYFERYFYTLEP